jgi:hypothetical protein
MRKNARRYIVGVGVVTILLAMGGSTARAQVIDQEQPVIDTTVGDLALGGYYNQQLAQVFTAGRTGLLVAAEFPLECVNFYDAPAGTITLEVRTVEAGIPTDTVLSTSLFQPAAYSAFWPNDFPPYLRRLIFTTPVPVVAGAQYALVLQFATSNGTSCGVAQASEGDSYLGGDGWYRENGPWGWAPFGPRVDMAFRTLMQEESRTSVLHKNHWICIDRSSLFDHLTHGDTVWMPGCTR